LAKAQNFDITAVQLTKTPTLLHNENIQISQIKSVVFLPANRVAVIWQKHLGKRKSHYKLHVKEQLTWAKYLSRLACQFTSVSKGLHQAIQPKE